MNRKWKYEVLMKPLELAYSTFWKETLFDLNKVSVLASWKPAFSLLKQTLEQEVIKDSLLQYQLLAFNKNLENIRENIDFQ